jgi:uncharacterized repeat protein (TIGR03806 family)
MLSAVSLSACGPSELTFHKSGAYPERLSDWGLIKLDGRQLQVSDQAMVYQINTALFSDYALKLRTLYLPEGTSGTYDSFDTFALPVGSIISKTFLYAKNADGELLTASDWNGDPDAINQDQYELLETRLLVRQSYGWDALPYIWRDGDAYLSFTGTLRSLTLAGGQTLNYLVPSKNQCASCHATNHTTKEIQPIGIKARHLDRHSNVYGTNQLTNLEERGWLEGLQQEHRPNALWADNDQTVEHQARSYLDINCGHCHNAVGAADTSGLLLDYAEHPMEALGQCKPPIAAGRGSGGHLYSIVPGHADESILRFRLATNDPGMMMPELGRSLVHKEGLALINGWINSLEGQCL